MLYAASGQPPASVPNYHQEIVYTQATTATTEPETSTIPIDFKIESHLIKVNPSQAAGRGRLRADCCCTLKGKV